MCVMAHVKPIGPTTYRATLAIRHRWWHCNGTMTYSRKIRSGSAVWRKWMEAQRKPWRGHWFDRPANAQPGSYEYARLAHIEMERIALRRPKIKTPG